MIISLQAKKVLVNKAEAYLGHLVFKEKEPKEVNSMPLVGREFLEVFKELLGLKPP